MAKHIIKKFDKNFRKLHDQILALTDICSSQLALVLEVVISNDDESRGKVRELERESDIIEKKIMTEVTTYIACQQPMAGDLRVLLSAIHISRSLERVSDNCRTLGRIAGYIDLEYHGKVPSKLLRKMLHHLKAQVKRFRDAFDTEDVEELKNIAMADGELNTMFEEIFQSYLTYMIANPDTITLNARLLFVAKNLERIGDHITAVASNTCYAITGEDIEDIKEAKNKLKHKTQL